MQLRSTEPEKVIDQREPGGAFYGIEKSVSGRTWIKRPVDSRLALAISQRFDLPDLIAELLVGRGVQLQDVEQYLEPRLRDLLPDPSIIQDMACAAQRLADAVSRNENIAVFGDYDVDGATSAALLVDYFRSIGRKISIYVPDRQQEGYGPNTDAMLHLAAQGATLVVTVDCGISAIEPLAAAADAGLDVIVVDHHLAGSELPRAAAIVNPKRESDVSGLEYLAAVGVTFLLVVATNRELRARGFFDNSDQPEPSLLTLLDLVALGTVCDVVPLSGLNRALVSQGLKVLNTWQRPGLAALRKIAEVDREAGTFELGFIFGPRVNAGGRIGQCDLGARLLSSQDPAECLEMAERLDRYNQERRAIEMTVLEAARDQIELATRSGANPSVLVAAARGWHAGVVGIVASRLKDLYHRPVFVLAIDESGTARGSGRSVSGVDLGGAIRAIGESDLLINGGGHAMAAGVTLDASRIDEFRASLENRLATEVIAAQERKTLVVDSIIMPQAANSGLLSLLDRLGPFGEGNREPVLVLPEVRVGFAKVVGGKHVRASLSGSGPGQVSAIAFRSADDRIGEMLLDRSRPNLHVAGHLRNDAFRGSGAVQFVVQDIAESS